MVAERGCLCKGCGVLTGFVGHDRHLFMRLRFCFLPSGSVSSVQVSGPRSFFFLLRWISTVCKRHNQLGESLDCCFPLYCGEFRPFSKDVIAWREPRSFLSHYCGESRPCAKHKTSLARAPRQHSVPRYSERCHSDDATPIINRSLPELIALPLEQLYLLLSVE